jgi:hypothetical protein
MAGSGRQNFNGRIFRSDHAAQRNAPRRAAPRRRAPPRSFPLRIASLRSAAPRDALHRSTPLRSASRHNATPLAMTFKPPNAITCTVNTARSVSGLGRTKIYELMHDGRLQSVTVDGRRLIVWASLEKLLAPEPTPGPAPDKGGQRRTAAKRVSAAT